MRSCGTRNLSTASNSTYSIWILCNLIGRLSTKTRQEVLFAGRLDAVGSISINFRGWRNRTRGCPVIIVDTREIRKFPGKADGVAFRGSDRSRFLNTGIAVFRFCVSQGRIYPAGSSSIHIPASHFTFLFFSSFPLSSVSTSSSSLLIFSRLYRSLQSSSAKHLGTFVLFSIQFRFFSFISVPWLSNFHVAILIVWFQIKRLNILRRKIMIRYLKIYRCCWYMKLHA